MKMNRVAAAAIALLAPIALASTAAASTVDEVDAAAKPVFEMPFPCKQIWRVDTWSGHNPAYAIDFNLPSGGDTDAGRTVIASAAGTVSVVGYDGSGYGHWVEINHGGGWTTRYAHLAAKTTLKKGQKVARKAVIGKVGKTGGQKYTHLHYEQRSGGTNVKAVLHGKAVKYYAKVNTASANC